MDALSEVFRLLDGAEKTPHMRELWAQARFYDQAVKHWTTVPPTFAQLDAMFDLVVELHGKTIASQRTRSDFEVPRTVAARGRRR
ncbi:MAG: hypothetical protein ACLQVI_21435 [Polyangiaceae bacterium]